MVELHTPASFKDPKFPILAFSVDDEDTNTRELFGEMKQPPHKLNVHLSLTRLHYSQVKIVI